jgi:hypothetical protein
MLSAMRWLFTEHLPELQAAALAAGHGVVSEGSTWASSYPLDDPTLYPLDRLVMQHAADVVVLVDPVRDTTIEGRAVQWGFIRDAIKRLKSIRRTLVVVTRDDPGPWEAFKAKRTRSCICRPNDAAVYVTNSDAVAAEAARMQRAVAWRAGMDAGPIVQAVEDVRAGKRYVPLR